MAKRDDDRLELKLTNKLGNIGLRTPCRIQVEVYQGGVTLKGMVLYDYQKRAAISAARSMDGVKSVIDQLKVQPPVKSWDDVENRPPESAEPPPGTE